MDGLDDLAAVDALEVDAGDAEVAVSELALDDDQRHAFARHLDGVGVTELVRREPAPHACRGGGAPQLGACRRGRPVPSARRAVDDAEQRADRELAPHRQARARAVPIPIRPCRPRDGGRPSAPDQQRAAALIEIALGQSERLLDAQPGSPHDHDQSA